MFFSIMIIVLSKKIFDVCKERNLRGVGRKKQIVEDFRKKVL